MYQNEDSSESMSCPFCGMADDECPHLVAVLDQSNATCDGGALKVERDDLCEILEESFRPLLENHEQPCPVDLLHHYRQVVGITVLSDREEERVVFRAITDQAHYITTKPIHHTQRILREEPGATVFAINVIPNFELESILLSYGERIEVLEPESLRLQMKERLQQAADQYSG